MAINVHLLKVLFLLFVSSLWSPHAQHVTKRNSLKPGETLNSSSSLVSLNRRFVLNFTRRVTNLTYLYTAQVWQPNKSINFVIWYASPGIPTANDSDMLTLVNDAGALKIRRPQGGNSITLCCSAQPTNNTVATLLDSGNFVFNEVYSNGSTKQVLWQSFDHLRYSLLPGMKLGVNHKTGQTWSLTSGLTTDNYLITGAFSLEWDPKVLELVIKRRGMIYWKSGVLRRDNQFDNISPDVTSMYHFNVVSNGDEDSFSFNYKNQSKQGRWTLTSMGQLRDYSNLVEPNNIARADNCYGYNKDGGCQIWLQPKCRHHGDTDDLNSGVLYDDPSYYIRDTNVSISDCRATCWSNCSCVAFYYLYKNATGCKFWTNISTFLPSESSRSDHFYTISSKPSPISGITKWIWISILVVVAMFLTFSSIVCYLLRRKAVLRGNNETEEENELLNLVNSDRPIDENEVPIDRKKRPDVSVFSYESIMVATNNFSLETKLGEGGFGPVYMGTLLSGQKIAIKRLSKTSRQGIIEFKNELMLISKLQHMNLVKLLGCCIFGEERMLIYEYMANKSLDYFLFDSNRSKLLDWKKRFNIIEGIAQGMIYLHKYSRLKIIHRDLKTSNILLDETMNPKISDFGMARIFKQNELEADTNRIVGTYGYMSPEYAMEGLFSVKSDVYSFGVLMLEIVSGRRNNSFYDVDHALNLVGYAWDLWQEGKEIELVDPTIKDSCIEYQVLRCIHASLLCVEDAAVDRPTMSEMLYMLSNESTPLPLPKKPAFSIRRKAIKTNISNKEPEVYTVNGLSVSDMDAR